LASLVASRRAFSLIRNQLSAVGKQLRVASKAKPRRVSAVRFLMTMLQLVQERSMQKRV
jgi:hypothetical protein